MLSDDTYLEWYGVAEEAEVAGQSLAEANIRERTGVSIVAIQRGETLISPPTPETILKSAIRWSSSATARTAPSSRNCSEQGSRSERDEYRRGVIGSGD